MLDTAHPLFLLWLPALAPFRTPSYTQSGSVALSLSATTLLPVSSWGRCLHPIPTPALTVLNQAGTRPPPQPPPPCQALTSGCGAGLPGARPQLPPTSHLPGPPISPRPVQGADPHALRSHPPRPTHGPRLLRGPAAGLPVCPRSVHAALRVFKADSHHVT